MDGITAEHVERYLKNLQPERDALMARMEREAQERDIPIIGPVAGRFLYAAAKLGRAERVLEFGTAIGYSTLWLARATEAWGGRITTVEINRELAAQARRNLEEAGVSDRVEVLVGDGLEVASRLEGGYDFCFIDADKRQYLPILEQILPRIESGGAVLADNVLWRGEVAHEGRDETAEALWEFNRHVMGHPKLEAVILPIRDGLALCLRR